MTSSKPLVTVATACDNILTESDGVLSVIRIVDVYTISAHIQAIGQPPQDLKNIEIGVPITAIICLKSGDFQGEGELSLKIQLPNGTKKEFPQKWTLLMEGAEKGVNIHLQFGVSEKHIGLSWIEIYWDNAYLTKFPIRLQQQEESKTTTKS